MSVPSIAFSPQVKRRRVYNFYSPLLYYIKPSLFMCVQLCRDQEGQFSPRLSASPVTSQHMAEKKEITLHACTKHLLANNILIRGEGRKFGGGGWFRVEWVEWADLGARLSAAGFHGMASLPSSSLLYVSSSFSQPCMSHCWLAYFMYAALHVTIQTNLSCPHSTAHVSSLLLLTIYVPSAILFSCFCLALLLQASCVTQRAARLLFSTFVACLLAAT